MNEKYFQTILQIITTGHWLTDQVSQELKEFGITEPQYNILRILKGAKNEPLTVQEVQKRMIQKSSNVTRIIDKLLKKNCVERKECPTNRRKMDITITTIGLDLLKKLDQKLQNFHQPLMNNLTDSELDTLYTLIKKIRR